MSTHLWDYLSESTAAYHQRSVDLLNQLHQLAPSPWVCEDVIGNALLSDAKVPALPALFIEHPDGALSMVMLRVTFSGLLNNIFGIKALAYI